MTFTKRPLIAVLLLAVSSSAMAWKESYDLKCSTGFSLFYGNVIKIKFSLIHPETDTATGVREPENRDPFEVLEREVKLTSATVDGKSLTAAKISNFELSPEGISFSLSQGTQTLKADLTNNHHSTDPNFVAEEYQGTASYSRIQKKQKVQVTKQLNCKTSEDLDDGDV